MDHDDYLAWLGLACLPTIGAANVRRLLAVLNDPGTLWNAPRRELLQHGVPPDLADRFLAERSTVDRNRVDEQCRTLGTTFLPLADPGFPVLLKEIPDPPLGLFMCGTLTDVPLALAVVGTRRTTGYGRQVTRDLARELGRSGATVVSGLAFGIDATAHEAAMETGRTIAVLPVGVDAVYPRAHQQLAERIVARGGALCTEQPPGTEIRKHHFPIRNRIIAGLVRGVVVTEAPERSGALLTAKLALDYNRDVFAVPGPVTSAASRGTHGLIRDGAVLVENAADVLQTYQIGAETPAVRTSQPLTETERTVLGCITRDPVTVDQIQNMSRLNTSVINATLVCLHMKGWIAPSDALHYVRT